MKQYLERRINDRVQSGESGFTLIELLVVMLIILILLAIAIPTFLGIINNAHNTGAASDLGNAIIEASADYTQDNGNFGATDSGQATTELQSMEPSLIFTVNPITSAFANVNSVVQVDACGNSASNGGCQSIALGAWSEASAACYFVVVNKSASPVTYGSLDMSGGSANIPEGTTYFTSGTTVESAGCNIANPAASQTVSTNGQAGGFPPA
jgi:type IV pilus assembly protein PilA